jgi:hypothetical protein
MKVEMQTLNEALYLAAKDGTVYEVKDDPRGLIVSAVVTIAPRNLVVASQPDAGTVIITPVAPRQHPRKLIARLIAAVHQLDALPTRELSPETEPQEHAVREATAALYEALTGEEPTSVQISMMFHGDDQDEH